MRVGGVPVWLFCNGTEILDLGHVRAANEPVFRHEAVASIHTVFMPFEYFELGGTGKKIRVQDDGVGKGVLGLY